MTLDTYAYSDQIQPPVVAETQPDILIETLPPVLMENRPPVLGQDRQQDHRFDRMQLSQQWLSDFSALGAIDLSGYFDKD